VSSIQEAVEAARREFLPMRGVVGVGWMDGAIVVYIETPDVARILPRTYMGFPVVFKVTGRLTRL